MSWSKSENDYPVTMSLSEIENREYDINYTNRGSVEPIFSSIKTLSTTLICDDYNAARSYVMGHIQHGESARVMYYSPKECSYEKCKWYEKKIRSKIANLKDYSSKKSATLQKDSPVSDGDLQGETIQAEINKRRDKIEALRNDYLAYRKTMPQEIRWFVYSQMYIG